MKLEGEARDRAQRSLTRRRLIPVVWPNAAAIMVAVGGALVAGDVPGVPLLPDVVGAALIAVGMFHLGSLAAADPASKHEAAGLRRALVTLGLSVSGDTGPAGGDGTPDRRVPQDIPREPVRERPPSGAPGPGGGLRLAPTGFNPDDAVERGESEPPIGGPAV